MFGIILQWITLGLLPIHTVLTLFTNFLVTEV